MVVVGTLLGAFIAPVVLSGMIRSVAPKDRNSSMVALVLLAGFALALGRNLRYYSSEGIVDVESLAALLGTIGAGALIIFLWP